MYFLKKKLLKSGHGEACVAVGALDEAPMIKFSLQCTPNALCWCHGDQDDKYHDRFDDKYEDKIMANIMTNMIIFMIIWPELMEYMKTVMTNSQRTRSRPLGNQVNLMAQPACQKSQTPKLLFTDYFFLHKNHSQF